MTRSRFVTIEIACALVALAALLASGAFGAYGRNILDAESRV